MLQLECLLTPLQALRILNLLEQHHKKLGLLLKSHHEAPSVELQTDPTSRRAQPTPSEPSSAVTTVKDATVQASASEAAQKPPRLPRASRVPGRDLSSSIASNLATARGIPGNQQRRGVLVSPTVSAQHAGGRFSNDQAVSKLGTDNVRASGMTGKDWSASNETNRKPSWTPPTSTEEPEDGTQGEPDTLSSEAPFQQFYSTFEALMSKITAPLAFASLPLLTTTTPPPTAPKTASATANATAKDLNPPAPTIPITAESLDYSQLISQAALRAVRNGVPTSNPAESFYVVPTEGGMA